MRRRQFIQSLAGSVMALSYKESYGFGLDGSTGTQIGLPNLRAHAKASMSFLRHAIDMPGGKLQPYHRITFHQRGGPVCAKPGFLRHAAWDNSENYGRWLYGRIFARKIVGDTSGLEFEESLRREISKGLGPDGLHYYPQRIYCDKNRNSGKAVLWDNRSIFMGHTQLWTLTGDNKLRRQLDRTVHFLKTYAVDGPGPDEAYFAVDAIPPGYHPQPVVNPILSLNTGGWVFPLLDYYRLSGCEEALELALRLANFSVHNHHPRENPPPSGPVLGIANVHGALFSIAGVAAAAPYSRNGDEYLAWARPLYEFTRDHLASAYGWVPELEVRPKGWPPDMKVDSEGCAIVDMVNLSTRLAQNGYPDAWNTVERFTRNYMDAGQLRDTRLLEKDEPATYTRCATNQGMPERARGAFVGHGGPADFFCPEGRRGCDVQDCCGSHYPFGLHLIWENIVTKGHDGIHVNLSFSHENPWCHVISERPYRGKVTVVMRKPDNLFIRVPDWVDKRQVEVRLGKSRLEAAWKGDYVYLRGLRKGAVVETTYPLRRETRRERFMGFDVEVEWRGDTAVRVSPEGKIIPLFNRTELQSS